MFRYDKKRAALSRPPPRPSLERTYVARGLPTYIAVLTTFKVGPKGLQLGGCITMASRISAVNSAFAPICHGAAGSSLRTHEATPNKSFASAFPSFQRSWLSSRATKSRTGFVASRRILPTPAPRGIILMEREAKFLDRSFAVLSRWTRALKTPRGSRASDPAGALPFKYALVSGDVKIGVGVLTRAHDFLRCAGARAWRRDWRGNIGAGVRAPSRDSRRNIAGGGL